MHKMNFSHASAAASVATTEVIDVTLLALALLLREERKASISFSMPSLSSRIVFDMLCEVM